MTSARNRLGRLVCGAGGALLIVSLFLPWAGLPTLGSLPGSPAQDASRSGWELWTMADMLFLIVGLVAIAAAITGGRFGLFRPDLSLSGAADLLGVVATILLAWLILFDPPGAASREIGVFLALIAAIAIAGGAGDYGTLRGDPLFPPTDGEERNTT